MTLEHLVIGIVASMILWTLWAMTRPDSAPPTSPARRPRTAAPTDVLPCLHDWTRHGYCAGCGEHTAAMRRARQRHPSNQEGLR